MRHPICPDKSRTRRNCNLVRIRLVTAPSPVFFSPMPTLITLSDLSCFGNKRTHCWFVLTRRRAQHLGGSIPRLAPFPESNGANLTGLIGQVWEGPVC